jgi:hypothetical protein
MASLSSHLLEDLRANADIAAAFQLIEHRFESDLASFEFKSSDSPALVVFPGEETTEESDGDGFVSQMSTRHVHCVVFTEHANLDDHKDLIRAVAVGWQHNPQHNLMKLQGGAPFRQVGAFIYWLETYTARVFVRSQN